MFGGNKLAAEPDSRTVMPSRVQHILVIDDDACQAEVLAYRFQKQGYHVSMAGTGADGLAFARSTPPDLVILDIRLPDADGLAICSLLTDDPVTSTVPVVIVSGMERPDIVRAARAAGCRFYVRKPYDPNALLTLAMAAMDESDCW